MHEPVIKRVLVWGGWLRLSHASTGIALLVLIFTGWLIAESPSLAESALDLHYLMSSLLVFGLVIRIVLLFAGKEHERLQALFPASSEINSMVKTLRFYISLGKADLPGWYAQNPLWKPFYLLMYIAITILAVTGVVMPDSALVLGFYLPSVHAFWAEIMLWLTLLHIVSVFVHDFKNKTTDISAMVNGYRLFIIRSSQGSPGNEETVQLVTLDSITRRD